MQAVRQLELSIVHERIVDSRVEQHIVLAGKIGEHRGKSAELYVTEASLKAGHVGFDLDQNRFRLLTPKCFFRAGTSKLALR